MYVRQDRNSANGFTVVTAFPIDEIIGSATRSLTVKQRAVVRDFLDEATSGRHSDAELQAMWCKTRAQIYVKKDDQVIEFLRMIRSHIA